MSVCVLWIGNKHVMQICYFSLGKDIRNKAKITYRSLENQENVFFMIDMPDKISLPEIPGWSCLVFCFGQNIV